MIDRQAISPSNIETVRRLLAANRSGPPEKTVETAASLVHPDLEFVSRVAAVEGGDYQGGDSGKRYFADMAEAFREWRNEPDEITELGPDLVLAESTFFGVGRDSGARVELKSAIVFRLEGGRIREAHSYATREEALEAAGI